MSTSTTSSSHTAANGHVWTVVGDHPDRAERLAQVEKLAKIVAPAIEADGGMLTITAVDLESGIVDVKLSGACGSCAVAGNTLEAGIERIFTQRIDWVTGIRGAVEESDATGTGGWTPH
ncbi:MAG TPA: NifU family protein [Ilumatobacteraceae bacterium]